jgi:phosphatidylinositol-3-phosphatase
VRGRKTLPEKENFMASKSRGRSVLAAFAFLLVAATAFAQVPVSQRVVLIIDENHSFSDVMADMPWLVGEGYANGYATNYESDNGGSLLDYLWLASGSCESSDQCALPPKTHNFNCNGNDCYYPNTTNSDPITDNNIFRDMNTHKISWKVYAEEYAEAGGTPTTPDNNNGTAYYRRHNGATWYSDILEDKGKSASNIVDLSQFATDLASGKLPRFAIIVPDGNHDAHDCPVGMATCTNAQQLAAADQFLSSTLLPLLSTPDFLPGGTGLILVTFDECGAGTDAGCGAAVYTTLIGPQVAPHAVSNAAYKHENSLRTIYESLGLKNYPGAAGSAEPMSDLFAGATGAPQVLVTSPANGATASSPVTIDAAAYPTVGHVITGWQVYVDSVDKYSGGAVNSISPKIAMSNGTHTIVVRAWDSSGAWGNWDFSLTVSAQQPLVTVSTPANGTTLSSPVNLIGSASPGLGHTISGWRIYVDGNGVYNAGAVGSINASVPMSLGTHSIVVRAWDTSGAYASQDFSLTVGTQPAASVSTP